MPPPNDASSWTNSGCARRNGDVGRIGDAGDDDDAQGNGGAPGSDAGAVAIRELCFLEEIIQESRFYEGAGPAMDGFSLQQICFLIAVIALTATAAYTDFRRRKIPNWLTIPFFFAGWIYQGTFFGWPGIQNGLAGFALGFGTYFVLWMVAGGGGGDVKLMGAISVWLGFRLTLYVMIVSTLLVVIDGVVVTLYTVFRHGFAQFKKKYLATGKTDGSGRPIYGETEAQRRQRRMVPFAIPLAMAAWLVLVIDVMVHG